MSPGIWQILIIVVIILLLFGRGKISSLMGDLGKGLKSFKKNIKDEDDQVTTETAEVIEAESVTAKKDSTPTT